MEEKAKRGRGRPPKRVEAMDDATRSKAARLRRTKAEHSNGLTILKLVLLLPGTVFQRYLFDMADPERVALRRHVEMFREHEQRLPESSKDRVRLAALIAHICGDTKIEARARDFWA